MSSILSGTFPTGNGIARIDQSAEGTRQRFGKSQLCELFSYLLSNEALFRQARERLMPEMLDPVVHGSHRLICELSYTLSDRLANGGLPANLDAMLRSEIECGRELPSDVAADSCAAIEVLDQICRVAHPEDNVVRGEELLRRFVHGRLLYDLQRELSGTFDTEAQLEIVNRYHDRLETADRAVAGFEMIDTSSFSQLDCANRFLVENTLVEGQLCVIGGAQKSLKTSIAVDLGISLGIGPPALFLGRFPVQQRARVGIFSGESGRGTLQETARRIVLAKFRRHEECRVYWNFGVPRLSDPTDLRKLAATIRQHELKVVIIDPLYLALLVGNRETSAANIYEMGPLLSEATRTCLDAGATPVFIHHFSRGRSQVGEPADLSHLAFAGITEIARQWLMIGRRRKFDGGLQTQTQSRLGLRASKSDVGMNIAGSFQWVELQNFPLGTESQRCLLILRRKSVIP